MLQAFIMPRNEYYQPVLTQTVYRVNYRQALRRDLNIKESFVQCIFRILIFCK